MTDAQNDIPQDGTPRFEDPQGGQQAPDSQEVDPTELLREIETRHEIKTMHLAGLSVATVYSLLVYQAKLLLLVRAAMPYASVEGDFHPLIGLMHQAEQLKGRTGEGALLGGDRYESLTDADLVDDDEAAESATEAVIALLSAGWVHPEDVIDFDPEHPVGPDFSFAEALEMMTNDALDYLPAELLLAEIGKIVVPALTEMSKHLNEE
jgi:hypothetical protein